MLVNFYLKYIMNRNCIDVISYWWLALYTIENVCYFERVSAKKSRLMFMYSTPINGYGTVWQSDKKQEEPIFGYKLFL